MGIWKEHFSPDVLLDWDVLGWIIGVALAIGGIVLVFDQFLWASICFVFVGLISIAKVVAVAVQHKADGLQAVNFAIVLCLVIVFITTVAVRGVHLYGEHKKNEPAEALKTPGHIHILDFTPLPMVAGQPANLNMSYQNAGDTTVKIRSMADVKLVRGLKNLNEAELKAIEEQMYQAMKTHEYELPESEAFAVPPYAAKFVTFSTFPVTQEIIDSIHAEDDIFIIVGIIGYVEPHDHKDVEFCVLWGNPNGKIIDCPIHNDE